MDDTFLLFSASDHVFHKYINSRHNNMTFTYETEKENKLAFLDVLVTRKGGRSFTTSLYRKPTFSGLYSNFESFMADSYKRGLILEQIPYRGLLSQRYFSKFFISPKISGLLY